MTALLMGIPGMGEVYPGTHVCALVSGTIEQDRLLMPFMQEGLRHGDRCVCFIDGVERAGLRRRLDDVDERDADRSGHLSFRSAPDAYLRDGGRSPTEMISTLVGASSSDHRRPLLRAAGQMAPARQEPDERALRVYESAVLLMLAAVPAVFLCLYDMQRFGVGTLADVMRYHSRILLEGTVLYNPRCVVPPASSPPGTMLGRPVGGTRTRRSVDGEGWRSLTGAEVRVAELVGTGMTNRATAEELIVSPHTVDAHLKHIYQKLGIHSRAELAVLSFRHSSQAARQPLPEESQ